MKKLLSLLLLLNAHLTNAADRRNFPIQLEPRRYHHYNPNHQQPVLRRIFAHNIAGQPPMNQLVFVRLILDTPKSPPTAKRNKENGLSH